MESIDSIRCHCKETKAVNGLPTGSQTSQDDQSKEILLICRICYNGNEEEPLLSPCSCSGSIKFVHQSCLLKWLKARKPNCELCNYNYVILKKAKPYREVSSLE